MYSQTSNISCTLVGNKIVDHSDVVGASPVGAAPTACSFLTPGLDGLDKDNCKMRQETFKFWDLVPYTRDLMADVTPVCKRWSYVCFALIPQSLYWKSFVETDDTAAVRPWNIIKKNDFFFLLYILGKQLFISISCSSKCSVQAIMRF